MKIHTSSVFQSKPIAIAIGLLFCMFFLGCDQENAGDCFKTAGTTITETLDVEVFKSIHVAGDLRLSIRQGDVQEVVLESGENIREEFSINVVDGILTARYDDGCNLARNYGRMNLLITTPQLEEIRNGTVYDVVGDGILTYPDLRLESTILDADVEPFYNSGGFDLEIENDQIQLESNGKAFFKLRGSTNQLNISFNDKTARLESFGLIAQNVYVFHRSANTVYINPQLSLSGLITGSGDVIAKTKPPRVEVEERYTGRLRYEQ